MAEHIAKAFVLKVYASFMSWSIEMLGIGVCFPIVGHLDQAIIAKKGRDMHM